MLEDLSIKSLRGILLKALEKEEYEKVGYIKWLINTKKNKPETYSMDMDKQINIILDEFDFDKVANVMEYLQWTWVKKINFSKNKDGGVIVNSMVITQPSVDELKKRAYGLLKDVWMCDECEPISSVSTGGFNAERCIYDGKKQLSLTFILSEWCLDYDAVRDSNY